ncbi:MAG TPA: glycosyltransferase family 1 protein [Chloroflexota bacterium]|nr:glycosyltransferase family 1 protein [Chloroflexota bacterium]
MLIGIEVSSAVAQRRSGVGNYTMNLVAELRRLHAANAEASFLYFANRGERLDLSSTDAPGLARIYPRDRLPSRMVWMQAGLPRSIARTRPDICHFPNHLAPLFRMDIAPYILTLHDMSVYRCPEHHALKTVLTHRTIMAHAARHARAIVTVSESARQDILHYLKVPPERVRVVYEGAGSRFQALAAPGDADDQVVRQRYGLPEHYILTVSTLEPRKNHARLIQAFTQLVQQEGLPHHLVVVGARGWKERALFETAARHNLSGRIHFLGYVPSADLPGLYRAASLFAFPSLYEGFGLPVLEAMACGVPCIISTDPALREVAGAEAAVVVDPHSVADIAAGLHRVLANPRLARQLQAKGIARASTFGWQTCAAETYALYREVLDGVAVPTTKRTNPALSRTWPAPAGSEAVVPSRSRSMPP